MASPAALCSVGRPRRIAEDTSSAGLGRKPCGQCHLSHFTTKAGEKSGLGDLNDRNRGEVIVGAKWDSPGSSPGYAGRAYVFTFPSGDISLSGATMEGELILQWSAFPGVSAYWIYGAPNSAYLDPGFAPTYEYRIAVLPPEAGMWSSANGIGDSSENWSYLVLAVCPAELELSRSNRVGEFDFTANIPQGK